MQFTDILLLVVVIVAIVVFVLYMLNRWAYKKMDSQSSMIEKTKTTQQVYVIDKRRDKITNVNMPKMVIDQIPKWSKFMKMNFVQVKVGPQILTLIADKRVFDAMPLKKTVKVELAGLYIVNIVGMKSAEEMKAITKAKKEKAKEDKKKKK